MKLNAIEEIDLNDHWYARLAMSLVLKTSDKEEVVWKYAFDDEREIAEQDTLGVVATLSGIYNDEIDKAIELLSDVVRSYPGCLEPSADDSQPVSR